MAALYKQMADDWIMVFGKKTMQGMSFSLAKTLAGYDSSNRPNRVSFGATLGITPSGVDYLDQFNGKDISAIAAISDDSDDEESPTSSSSSSKLKLGKKARKATKFALSKDEETSKIVGRTHILWSEIYHRWNALNRPLIIPRMIVEKKKVYGLLSILVTTVSIHTYSNRN